jgi:hypothetical protein
VVRKCDVVEQRHEVEVVVVVLEKLVRDPEAVPHTYGRYGGTACDAGCIDTIKIDVRWHDHPVPRAPRTSPGRTSRWLAPRARARLFTCMHASLGTIEATYVRT